MTDSVIPLKKYEINKSLPIILVTNSQNMALIGI